MTRKLLCRLTLASVLLVAPPSFASPNSGIESMAITINLAFLVPPVLVFGIADTVYAGRREWTPLGWAIPEIVAGAGIVMLGGVMAVNSLPGMSVANFVPAGLMIGHGVLSLALYEPPKNLGASVSPTEGGASLTVYGTF